ncbi:MAG: DUF5317 family protein [Jiangellaceae bacterium]
MTLVLLALALGVAVGYARGGGLAGLAGLRLRRHRLLLTALGLYALGVLGGWIWDPLLAALAATAWLTIGFYAWVNRDVRGATLVALGLTANGLVLLLNGAVPVAAEATARAGADVGELVETAGHEAITSATRLPGLGKTVPVAFPPRPEVVSPGDVAVAAGLALTVVTGMTRRTASGAVPPLAARETMAAEPEPQRSAAS